MVLAQTRRHVFASNVWDALLRIAMTAAALDEGRSGNLQRQSALLHHIYAVLESAAHDPAHEMQWDWPILGIKDPDGPALAFLAPAETECGGCQPQ